MEIRGKGIRGFAKGKAFKVTDFTGRNPFEGIPEGSILLCPTVTLSDSTLIDFRKVVAIVTSEPDTSGEVCLIASGMGIPAVLSESSKNLALMKLSMETDCWSGIWTWSSILNLTP